MSRKARDLPLDHQRITFSVEIPAPGDEVEGKGLDVRDLEAVVARAREELQTLVLCRIKVHLGIPLEPEEQAILDKHAHHED